MRALMANGSEIAKDCNCTTHDGPHWLYLDGIERLEAGLGRVANRSVETFEAQILLQHYLDSETKRLEEKERTMRRLGIVRLL